jgi:VIT1/CCC1 family predicted Fe2+/Mn2+ transporter
MKRRVLAVLISAAASVLSGALFVLAFFHQFALVEVAASLLTGLQVFFLSSTIGDLLEETKETNKARNVAVVSLAALLVVFFLIAYFWRSNHQS